MLALAREKRLDTSCFFARYETSEAAGVKPAGAGMVEVVVVVVVTVVVNDVAVAVGAALSISYSSSDLMSDAQQGA